MSDDLRARGTVTVNCDAPECSWSFWVHCTDARLPNGPFLCMTCANPGWDGVMWKCACGAEEVLSIERCFKCAPEGSPVLS